MTVFAATTVLVLAKAPVPGRVKTRLCPPYTPGEAAAVAEAALADTLEAVARSNADRRVLALDGGPGPWLPAGFEVIPQASGGLAARLTAAWMAVGGLGLQVGMDTPQITAQLLDASLGRLVDGRVDAVLGPAHDGGWWSVGFRRPHPRAFAGVAMSRADTGARQLARLRDLGLRVGLLPTLRDIDRAADALAVAALAPATRTAGVVRSLQIEVGA